MTKPDPQDLMKQCAAGDHNAFRALAILLGPRMFALAYRLMGYNRANAEDAVQDALIKFWVGAPRWQPSGRVEAWASTIVHHCCMDLHRKNKPTTELQDTVPDKISGAEHMIATQQQHGVLMNGINQLPERQRSALLLAYFGDTSNRQIAQSLKLSEKAVESLLVRARRTLAQTLPPELRHEMTQGE